MLLHFLIMIKNKIGNKIKEKQIYDIEKLPELAKKKLNIEMAILTVPMAAAQDIANFLVKSNIKYIWNFSPNSPCNSKRS